VLGVLPGEAVDLLVRLVALDQLDDAAADVHLVVGIVPVGDRDRDARVAAHVALLEPADRRVERDVAVLGLDPDRARVRRAVLHHVGQERQVRPFDLLRRRRSALPAPPVWRMSWDNGSRYGCSLPA
jgi:hypothetical protein